MMGIEKIGFTNAVTNMEPIMIKITCVESRIAFGKNSSSELNAYYEAKFQFQFYSLYFQEKTHPISFENLFITLPHGFVSKKCIFVDIKPLNIPSCNY